MPSALQKLSDTSKTKTPKYKKSLLIFNYLVTQLSCQLMAVELVLLVVSLDRLQEHITRLEFPTI